MSDVGLPQAPDQGEPSEKKGLLSRSVGAVKQAQAQAQAKKTEKHAEAVNELDARFKAGDEALRVQRQALLDQGYELYEYRVVPVRSTLVGDKMNVGDLQGTLDQWSAQGWRVRSIVETQVSGRVGPGGVGGLIIVFERRLTQA
jgi:Domain of unknown function (DUF4177)